MIGRTTGRPWFDALESKYFEIEFIDERLNNPDRILLADIVLEPFGEQCALGPVFTFNKTLHGSAVYVVRPISIPSFHVFTQPRPIPVAWPMASSPSRWWKWRTRPCCVNGTRWSAGCVSSRRFCLRRNRFEDPPTTGIEAIGMKRCWCIPRTASNRPRQCFPMSGWRGDSIPSTGNIWQPAASATSGNCRSARNSCGGLPNNSLHAPHFNGA
ncbi:MAG: hypothetical protein USCGTAYLOR_02863 [Chromatiales bacterium USCg_Taylor]|nr:MAG: hypothetical protein USCGTAYLOR_02863 [Chromatiales bacterium USCg_Taylor]